MELREPLSGGPPGYLVRPAAAGEPLPGVLVIQELWGVDDHIRDVAARHERITRLVEPFSESLRQLGKPFEAHVYPGAPHAFFNDNTRWSYRAGASCDAWARTRGFFRGCLNA